MNSLEKAQQWLKSPFDEETIEEVRSLIDTDPGTLNDSFYTDLADRKSTRLNSSHSQQSRMPSSA